jgi:hypothetical protein
LFHVNKLLVLLVELGNSLSESRKLVVRDKSGLLLNEQHALSDPPLELGPVLYEIKEELL